MYLILRVLCSFAIEVNLIEQCRDQIIIHDCPTAIDVRANSSRGGADWKSVQEQLGRICISVALQRALEALGSCCIHICFELRIVCLKRLCRIIVIQGVQLRQYILLRLNSVVQNLLLKFEPCSFIDLDVFGRFKQHSDCDVRCLVDNAFQMRCT